ncbi:S-adenosyl-L-methionine-dependent methyltransferase [Heliocybe sulcata]|uniref:S-adenosyl-L-methionine-dependent methyltransferase n=1 Tax=Heliocybe sulcata TaxID=5364 RepID=A0A5C3NV54_9AGAM|nr:S-adenosyl-L-methionine-dependent methyltransferase [Heliocybe sulcata]
MIPTPDLSHLTRKDYEHVYEPAEDTFILLDALEQDAEYLRSVRPKICLEIGSGSGCVSSFLGTVLGGTCSLYLCTDINPHATQCTVRTGKQNKVELNAVLASFADPLNARLRGSVDVLLFNPPYVPTIGEEATEAQSSADIQGAWAGGEDGMQVTNRLLDMVESLLSSNGCFYLVAVKQNNVPGIQAKMLQEYGLHSEVVLHRRAGGEHLFVIKIFRGSSDQ